MENRNWFKKNATWLIPLLFVMFSFVADWNKNCKDVVRGFNEGWHSAK